MITKIRFQWGLHCSPNESPAYYHFQIIQDIKLNPRQIWCSYLFASKICVHFATQILERERFMIYSVFSDRTTGNHWSENRILIKFGKRKYLVFLPRQTDNQICFWSRNVTSFELPLHTSQKHCGGIIMKSRNTLPWQKIMRTRDLAKLIKNRCSPTSPLTISWFPGDRMMGYWVAIGEKSNAFSEAVA